MEINPGPISVDKGVETYIVEKILDERKKKGKTEYQVKWLGWEDEKDRTWEPYNHLKHLE